MRDSRRRADPLVLLADQLLVREMLVGITPDAVANLGVEHLARLSASRSASALRVCPNSRHCPLEPRQVRFEAVDPDAKPPIQSSPSGLMNRRGTCWDGLPVLTCWRRKGTRSSRCPPAPAHRRLRACRPKPTVALGTTQRRHQPLSIACASRTGFERFRRPPDRRGSRIIARQLPGAEKGGPVDRRAQVAQRHSPTVEAGALRRRG